jgi:hypothetical protein
MGCESLSYVLQMRRQVTQPKDKAMEIMQRTIPPKFTHADYGTDTHLDIISLKTVISTNLRYKNIDTRGGEFDQLRNHKLLEKSSAPRSQLHNRQSTVTRTF